MGRYFPRVVAVLQCVFDGFGGDDSDPLVIDLIPKSAAVHLTGYKEADTFDLTFDVRKLPLSPDLLRSVGVEIYVFQTDGHVTDVRPYLTGPMQEGDPDHLAVAGIVDRAGMHLSEGGKIKLDGRDYTGLMIDKKWPSDKRVPVGLPLDETVKLLVDECALRYLPPLVRPVGRALRVRFIGRNVTQGAPIVGTEGPSLTRKRVKGPAPTTGHKHSRTHARGLPVKSGKNYWDVIYGLCLRHGFIVYVRGDEVIITDPKTLTEDAAESVVSMVYGKNLKELTVSRKLTREVTPQIVVNSYDPITCKTISGKWPIDYKGKQTAVGVRTEEQRIVTVAGVRDEAELQRLAQLYYNNASRAESKIEYATRALSDLSPQTKDLTLLRPGQAIGLRFDPFNRELIALQYRQRDFAGMRETLIAQGYSSQVSDVVVDYYDRIHQFERPFYARSVSFAWDTDSGIAVSGEAINYVSVERDDRAVNG